MQHGNGAHWAAVSSYRHCWGLPSGFLLHSAANLCSPVAWVGGARGIALNNGEQLSERFHAEDEAAVQVLDVLRVDLQAFNIPHVDVKLIAARVLARVQLSDRVIVKRALASVDVLFEVALVSTDAQGMRDDAHHSLLGSLANLERSMLVILSRDKSLGL